MAKSFSKDNFELSQIPSEKEELLRFIMDLAKDSDKLRDFYQAATIGRCGFEPAVIALQDTTEIAYEHSNPARRFHLHAGLAVSLDGSTLGMFDYDIKSLRAKLGGKNERAKVAANESAQWLRGIKCAGKIPVANPATRVINVFDHDTDFWQMLKTANSLGCGLLVRSSPSTKWSIYDAERGNVDLWSHLAEQPTHSKLTVSLERYGGTRVKKVEEVDVAVRAVEVMLEPPEIKPGIQPTRMLALSAIEYPAKKRKNLHWLLLSTEGLTDINTESESVEQESVLTVLHLYALRSRIESYFATLKAGIKIKRHGFNRDDTRKRVVFDVMHAQLITEIERCGRIEPSLPADQFVNQELIDRLNIMVKRLGHPLPVLPTVRSFAIGLGRCAGFGPKINSPYPGIIKIWQGFDRLMREEAAVNFIPPDGDDIGNPQERSKRYN